MFKSKLIILAGLFSLVFWNCSGNKPKFKAASNNHLEKLQKKKNKFNKKGILAEIAIGESTNLQVAINKAELEARAKLSRSVESKTSSLQKKFQEEVGNEFLDHFKQVAKTVTDRVMHGTSLVETPFEKNGDGVYRVYGLMVLDYELYAKALSGEISANNAMKTRWQASRAYQELEDEVKAYQQWKQEQNRPPAPQKGT